MEMMEEKEAFPLTIGLAAPSGVRAAMHCVAMTTNMYM